MTPVARPAVVVRLPLSKVARARLVFLTFLGIVTFAAIACNRKNHPPYPPDAPAGPALGKAHANYPFVTRAVDPDGDSVSYEFDWGDGLTTDWSQPKPSGTSYSASSPWYKDGKFTIRARAKDNHEAISQWSVGHNLNIGNHPPQTPVIDSGPDTLWPGTIGEFHAHAYDMDNDSVSFIVDWGDGDTIDYQDWVPSGVTWKFGRAWLASGSHTVRIQARDSQGSLSDWSAPWEVLGPGPALLWRHYSSRQLESSPAIGPDGTVYFGSMDHHLYALNPDGSLDWSHLASNAIVDPPSVSSKAIYVRSDDNRVYALDDTGGLRWSVWFHHVSRSILRAPAIGPGGTVYFRSDSLYAFDVNGTRLWSNRNGGKYSSSAAVAANGTVYFASDLLSHDSLFALSPDGAILWALHVPSSSRYLPPPALGDNGRIYYLGLDGALVAFSPDGIQLWTCPIDGHSPHTSPVIDVDGTVYCAASDGVYAVDPFGVLSWHFETAYEVRSTPAVTADGTIIFGCDDHRVYALDRTGALKWARKTGGKVWTSPAVAPDGTIYFGSQDGYLYALQGGSPLADSPWPMLQHDAQHSGRANP